MLLAKRSRLVQASNARSAMLLLRRSSDVPDYKMSPGVKVIENSSEFSSQVCLEAPT
jgi:hypothetical protein